MAVSQNGYVANDISRTQSYTITGTARAVRLRKGSPGAILVHFAAWFDKNVEDIEAGQLDDWGYAERPIRGGVELSNHASGTAIDLNSTKHPLGARDTFTKAQAAKIRAKLKDYNGCIRWGGDYTNRADEMHFEIVRDVAACDAALKKVTTPPPTDAPPSKGPTDMALTDADKAWITGELTRFFTFLEKPDGNLDVQLDNHLAPLQAQLDRIEDDTDDGTPPAPKA